MTNEQLIFDCWNKQKENGRWKTHRKLTPDIETAVKGIVSKGWEVEDICCSIRNFAKVLQGRDYKWTYDKWGLATFLTRGTRDNDPRWLWFHPNNYREEEWLTDSAKKERRAQRRVVYKEEAKKEIVEVTDKEKAAIKKAAFELTGFPRLKKSI